MQTLTHTPALSGLFARYVAGQIADANWHRLMGVFDAHIADTDECRALAAFVNDAADTLGPQLDVPKPQEAHHLLAEIHA